jgi:hypothetical protein
MLRLWVVVYDYMSVVKSCRGFPNILGTQRLGLLIKYEFKKEILKTFQRYSTRQYTVFSFGNGNVKIKVEYSSWTQHNLTCNCY